MIIAEYDAIYVYKKSSEGIFLLNGKPVYFKDFEMLDCVGANSFRTSYYPYDEKMFSEEYQSEFIEKYCNAIKKLDYMIGARVWCFSDFKAAQSPLRVVLCRKGVFTRDRQPKLAAHTLRRLWK